MLASTSFAMDVGRFGDEKRARDGCPLGVVLHGEVGVDAVVVRAASCERREDHTVRERDVADLDGLEKGTHWHCVFGRVTHPVWSVVRAGRKRGCAWALAAVSLRSIYIGNGQLRK